LGDLPPRLPLASATGRGPGQLLPLLGSLYAAGPLRRLVAHRPGEQRMQGVRARSSVAAAAGNPVPLLSSLDRGRSILVRGSMGTTRWPGWLGPVFRVLLVAVVVIAVGWQFVRTLEKVDLEASLVRVQPEALASAAALYAAGLCFSALFWYLLL